MCDLQLAPLVERFGAAHDAGREHRGKQDAKNRAEGAHEVKRDKYNDGDDRDDDPDAGLALEELPAAGDPGPAVAGRHGMSLGNEILLRSHGGSPLVTSLQSYSYRGHRLGDERAVLVLRLALDENHPAAVLQHARL